MTQEELRVSLTQRFLNTKRVVQRAIDEYTKASKEGLFEDKEGEAEGSGDARKSTMQKHINSLLTKAEKIKTRLESKEPLPHFIDTISTTYEHSYKTKESITLSLEEKLKEYLLFYKKHNIPLPQDFEDRIEDIWNNNTDEIQESIEQHGFDDMLILPGNIPLETLNTVMTEGYKTTFQTRNFIDGGSFSNAKSQHVDTPRIVLVHKTQNLFNRPELKQTLNIKAKDIDQKNTLTLEDYLVFQRKYFEDTGRHLDVSGWTWVATTSGARLVNVFLDSGAGRLYVDADDFETQTPTLGARPSRSFF